MYSGYSEHTGTSSRAGNFIGDAFCDNGISGDIFASFKYFAGDGGAEQLSVALEILCGAMPPVDY
jgi:hypothetical protein